ncbi:hypothetical protein A3SI_07104 [Nitritalea halalkaliphila LW7]|uniref:Uncharacterized protein n=1 Tax=Nitritalea halalkaliphila LW7 TaxID=1189621 RepID=I5C5G7_9BACT|nr:hypothetical protein [Nitritalea halalkaliphila]EIM77069.1 hypothetical protein A3SI_07104 [Nitritalea halalkaliphila LW7]
MIRVKKEHDLEKRWSKLLLGLEETIGKRPKDLNGVLFLIGVQELGRGNRTFTKEEKQDLMHIAICKVLSLNGYYSLDFIDQEGWPHWKLEKELPHFDILEQEKLLKLSVLTYFEEEFGIEIL